MPTTYTDQFWIIDPFSPPPVGTLLVVSNFTIVDDNDDTLIDGPSNDTIDGVDVTQSYPGDTVTVNLPGGGTITFTGTTFYLADGRQVFTPTDGGVLFDATLVSTTFVSTEGPLDVGDLGPPCFLHGTRIATPMGETLVETLKPGDHLLRADGGISTLVRPLTGHLSGRTLRKCPKLFPVRIRAGALGAGLPRRDLWVTRQHRMLVQGPIVARMFGVPEVLVAAIKLTALPGISVDTSYKKVSYTHLLLPEHEVILAEGAPTESLLPGPVALQAMTPQQRRDLEALFPQIGGAGFQPQPARPIPSGKQQTQLMARHARNAKPVLSPQQGKAA